MGRAIALGLVAVLVIAGAAIMGMQLLDLKKGEAARAAARARAERMRAEIYQGAPSPELAKRVASELDPRAAGLYQLCLGRIYRQLGMARRADAALTNAGVYFKSGRRRALYQYERGRLFQDQGRAKEAEAALREAVELAIDPIHRASCRDALGEFLTNVGRVEEAERELRKAHERFAGKPGDDRRLAHNLRNLGLLLWVTGRADEAEAAIRRSLAIRQKLACADWDRLADSRVLVPAGARTPCRCAPL